MTTAPSSPVAARNPRPGRAGRKAAHGRRYVSADLERADRGLQSENEPRPGVERHRRGGASDGRPPQIAVADRRVERWPGDALRAQRRTRAGTAVAGGGAAGDAHVARTANARRAADQQRPPAPVRRHFGGGRVPAGTRRAPERSDGGRAASRAGIAGESLDAFVVRGRGRRRPSPRTAPFHSPATSSR